MTYFADLSPYRYADPAKKLGPLNVGWLDIAYPFPKGTTTPEFHQRLLGLCREPVNLTFGYHECQFCEHPTFGHTSEYQGEPVILGNGEIWVYGQGNCYAAPTLVYHYVVDHGYLPPDGFIQAVLTCQETWAVRELMFLVEEAAWGRKLDPVELLAILQAFAARLSQDGLRDLVAATRFDSADKSSQRMAEEITALAASADLEWRELLSEVQALVDSGDQ